MNPQFKIQIYQLDERFAQLTNLFDAYRVFYGEISDLEGCRDFLMHRIQEQSSIILVAESGETLVGFSQLYPSYSSVSMKELYILNVLFVKDSHRGFGAGKALLQYAMHLAMDNYWKGLILETSKDNPAQYLYESMGWAKDVEYLHYSWKTPE